MYECVLSIYFVMLGVVTHTPLYLTVHDVLYFLSKPVPIFVREYREEEGYWLLGYRISICSFVHVYDLKVMPSGKIGNVRASSPHTSPSPCKSNLVCCSFFW